MQATREVIVVGAGIVGVSLAHELAAYDGVRVTVLEQAVDSPLGSTTFAPGFVGLYNDLPLLTELAQTSAASYLAAGVGFTQAGGLELTTSETGAAEITRRVASAKAVGLAAHLLAPSELPESVAAFVDTRKILAAAHFPDDGVAAPVLLMSEALLPVRPRPGGRIVAISSVSGRNGRPGQLPEIAEAVAYFASPMAGFTTGQILGVDGGTLLSL